MTPVTVAKLPAHEYAGLTDDLARAASVAFREWGRRGARVVAVSSAGHHQSAIRWDDVQFTKGYHKWLASGQSVQVAFNDFATLAQVTQLLVQLLDLSMERRPHLTAWLKGWLIAQHT